MGDLAQRLAEVLMDRFPDDGAMLVTNPAGWLPPPDERALEFQLGWWAALTMVAETATTALTDREQAVIQTVADLANEFVELCGDGPTSDSDFAEVLPHLHALQQAVMAQAAARTYPRRYRTLGGHRDDDT